MHLSCFLQGQSADTLLWPLFLILANQNKTSKSTPRFPPASFKMVSAHSWGPRGGKTNPAQPRMRLCVKGAATLSAERRRHPKSARLLPSVENPSWRRSEGENHSFFSLQVTVCTSLDEGRDQRHHRSSREPDRRRKKDEQPLKNLPLIFQKNLCC